MRWGNGQCFMGQKFQNQDKKQRSATLAWRARGSITRYYYYAAPTRNSGSSCAKASIAILFWVSDKVSECGQDNYWSTSTLPQVVLTKLFIIHFSQFPIYLHHFTHHPYLPFVSFFVYTIHHSMESLTSQWRKWIRNDLNSVDWD